MEVLDGTIVQSIVVYTFAVAGGAPANGARKGYGIIFAVNMIHDTLPIRIESHSWWSMGVLTRRFLRYPLTSVPLARKPMRSP